MFTLLLTKAPVQFVVWVQSQTNMASERCVGVAHFDERAATFDNRDGYYNHSYLRHNSTEETSTTSRIDIARKCIIPKFDFPKLMIYFSSSTDWHDQSQPAPS